MKKTLFISLILLIIAIILPQTVLAVIGDKSEPHIVDTVDELIDAFAAGGYIKLEANIEVGEFAGNKFVVSKGKTVNLDLNGYTLSGIHSDATSAAALIYNNGTLIINDSSSKKTGEISMNGNGEGESLYTYAHAIVTILNTGTLSINGGTLENRGNLDCPYVIDNNSTTGNVDLTINGGNLYSRVAVRAFANSTTYTNDIIVNGGNITGGSSAIWLQQPTKKANKASITVNGGTIYGEKYNGIYADIYNEPIASDAVSITIKGGSIGNNSETSASVSFVDHFNTGADGDTLNNATLNLTISGGTIYNKNASGPVIMDKLYTTNGNTIKKDNIKITKGKFSSDVSEYLDSASGASSFKNEDGMFHVGILNNIIINDASNGIITSSLAKAIEGQKVTLTATPEEGYKLDKLTVFDDNNNQIKVDNGVFIMPSSEVTIVAEFKIIKTEVDYILPDTSIGVVEEEKVKETLDTSLKADKELNEKVEEATKNGETVKVEIKMEALDKDNVKEEEKQIILQTVKANQKVYQYFDISVLVTSNQIELGKLTQLTDKIKFSIEISKDLIQEGRTFYILKLHNGEVKRIEAKLNGTNLEFETDEFSTFALAYEDVETSSVESEQEPLDNINDEGKDETPKTGSINVPIHLYLILACVSLIGILIKKQENNK